MEATDSSLIARVIEAHKERYVISDGEENFIAELTGNLRFSASSSWDFPVVGDNVVYQAYDENNAIIRAVLSRKTILQRKSVKNESESQLMAANIDYAFIVQSVDRDYNLNRFERYFSICKQGGVIPVAVLSKVDLIAPEQLKSVVEEIKSRLKEITIISLSSYTGSGIKELNQLMEQGKTYCMLGSSGVGKSTLINKLLNSEVMATKEISSSTSKGKHTTTYRKLFTLDNGSFLIDTPGMRELGVGDASEGIDNVFEEISALADECKFVDCKHQNEPGCKISESLENGSLDMDKYNSYLKLKKEAEHFERTSLEKKQKDKEFGKMVKSVMLHHKKRKY